MRKLITGIIILALLVIPTHCQERTWVWIGETKSANIYLLEQNNITTNRTVVLKTIMKTGHIFFSRHLCDCNKQKIKIISLGEWSFDNIKSVKEDWVIPRHGSLGDLLIRKICKDDYRYSRTDR